MHDHAIACTLDGKNSKDRLAWIIGLNASALKTASRTDFTLTLEYDQPAVDDVRKLVAREQVGCAFLEFRIDEQPDSLRVTIIAPEEAREAAEVLFESFAAWKPTAPAKACGCLSECGA